MPRTFVTLCRLCLAVLLVSTIVACGSEPTPAAPGTSGMGVNITSASCPSGTVRVGDAVTWTNADSADHQVLGTRDNLVLFDSGFLAPGDTFTFVFADEGQFPYTCSIDGSLIGTITVEP